MSRFLAMAVLHLQIEPVLRRSLGMLKYLVYHVDDFENKILPFSTIMNQIIVCISIETVSMLLICQQ